MRTAENLQQAALIKKELVSALSHDLRTPLTSIKGSLQLLIQTAQSLDPSQEELLNICLRNTDRLISLIDGLLSSSRTDSGESEDPEAPQVNRNEAVPGNV